MGPSGIPYILMLMILVQGVAESWALVRCYQCSYYTVGEDKVERNCKTVENCGECQTRFFISETHELVSRDCVSRCVPGGVPVKFENIQFQPGEEKCCSTDLCNVHPSGAGGLSQTLSFHSFLTLIMIWLLVS